MIETELQPFDQVRFPASGRVASVRGIHPSADGAGEAEVELRYLRPNGALAFAGFFMTARAVRRICDLTGRGYAVRQAKARNTC